MFTTWLYYREVEGTMAAKPVTTVQDCVSPLVTETPLNFFFFFFFAKTLGQSPILFVVTREDIWMRSQEKSPAVSLATKDLKSQAKWFLCLNLTRPSAQSCHNIHLKTKCKASTSLWLYDELRLAKHDDLVFGRVSKLKCFQTSSVVKA